jgi:transcriptional regulator with XRE-family HTH domain
MVTTLQAQRTAQGMSQRALAAKAGVTQTMICHIENGLRPSRKSRVLEAVAAVLHVPAASLLNDENGP